MGLEELYNEVKKRLDKYDDKNIFNSDETGLFWKCTQQKPSSLEMKTKRVEKLSGTELASSYAVVLPGKK